jgi:hypothetical protein
VFILCFVVGSVRETNIDTGVGSCGAGLQEEFDS